MTDQFRTKRGVVDLVLLIDCSASMHVCLPTIVKSLAAVIADLDTEGRDGLSESVQ
jgi:hypothetical protein